MALFAFLPQFRRIFDKRHANHIDMYGLNERKKGSCEAFRPSRQDGTGTPGLPGNGLLFYGTP